MENDFDLKEFLKSRKPRKERLTSDSKVFKDIEHRYLEMEEFNHFNLASEHLEEHVRRLHDYAERLEKDIEKLEAAYDCSEVQDAFRDMKYALAIAMQWIGGGHH
jgi:hypothetical protein